LPPATPMRKIRHCRRLVDPVASHAISAIALARFSVSA
jgi:hypothetical protein